MRIVPDTGADRVVDILRPWLRGGNRVDVASGGLSIFAFGELAEGLARLAETRLVVPPDSVQLDLLGGSSDRTARNRLQGRWLAGRCAAWIEKATQALAPSGETTVVFRDSAFADDVAKTNLVAILEQRGLGNVRSL